MIKTNVFFGGPAFIQPIRAIKKVFKKPWLAGKKPALQKSHFCFDHVKRLIKRAKSHKTQLKVMKEDISQYLCLEIGYSCLSIIAVGDRNRLEGKQNLPKYFSLAQIW